MEANGEVYVAPPGSEVRESEFVIAVSDGPKMRMIYWN